MAITVPPVLLVTVSLPLLLIASGARAAGQEGKVELKDKYHESFNGPASKYPAWGLHGPQAANTVKFESEGLRVNLPPGFERQRPASGVATRVTLNGNFQITASYEILQEPTAEEVGNGQTRLTMDVVLAQPRNNAVTLSRRVVPRAGKQVFPWMFVWDADAGKSVQRNMTSVPAKALKGRLRIERSGTKIGYYLAEGDDGEFTRVSVAPFSNDDVAEVRLVATTGGTTAALDVRFHDIEIRAEKIVRPPTAPVPADIKPPQKEYAQEYQQSFKGNAALPTGWDFVGPFAENCVQFEAAGVRIKLPAGWDGERQATGIKSNFGINGDFEITLTFEILAEPAPGDAGKAGTRVSLGIWTETPRSNVATINRSTGAKDGTNFVCWQSLWNEEKGKSVPTGNVFRTPAKIGRLRLIRSGPHLYYGFAEGLDGDFRFRTKYNFGPEDLREVRIIASTGGEQAAIDVRATDLRIRADAIPNAPAAAPVAAGNAEMPALEPARSRPWLVASLLIGGVILVVVLATLGATIVLARAKKTPQPAAKEIVKKRK